MTKPSSHTTASSRLETLPINSLEPNPFQPREKIKTEEIQELADSIKTHGVIEPLLVAQTPAGYQIIAGERRWRAAKMVGLKELPASIIKTSPRKMLELALVENVQRQDLHAIERAKGFQQLMREFSLSVSEIAERVGKSTAYVSNSLRLLTLPDLIKDAVIEGLITEGHARALAGVEDEELQVKCFKRIVATSASVRAAEEIVRQAKQQQDQKPTYLKPTPKPQRVKAVRALEQQLKANLKTPTIINLSRSSVQTRVVITLKGNEKMTDDDLSMILKLLGAKKS